jgi:uncharacterized protein
LAGKLARLEDLIRGYGSLVVAFSGGVDSSFLCVVAHRVLGERMTAVTARSPLLPQEELEEARELARRFLFPHLEVESRELDDTRFTDNSPERCYFCKSRLMEVLEESARARGARVALGANVDDLCDYRPGERAAQERGAVFPLREAGLRKTEIRALSRALQLPTAEKPSLACLASRIPFGDPITLEKLERVGRAEAALRRFGFSECRVRHHGELARVEVRPEQLAALVQAREEVLRELKTAGFVYVTLDLQGFRSGSMHEARAGAPRP